jgi:cell wall-associated NlpC family hydrolase
VERLKNADSLLGPDNTGKMEIAGRKLAGLPYDSYFGWADDRIYCSELIYKIYRNALGIEIGKTAKLEDFDLSNPAVQAKLKERYRDGIPMEEEVISPASQFGDPKLFEVFNNY